MGQCMHVRCYLNTRSGLLGLAIELNCQEYVGLCKMGSGGGELDVPGSLYAVSSMCIYIQAFLVFVVKATCLQALSVCGCPSINVFPQKDGTF